MSAARSRRARRISPRREVPGAKPPRPPESISSGSGGGPRPVRRPWLSAPVGVLAVEGRTACAWATCEASERPAAGAWLPAYRDVRSYDTTLRSAWPCVVGPGPAHRDGGARPTDRGLSCRGGATERTQTLNATAAAIARCDVPRGTARAVVSCCGRGSPARRARRRSIPGRSPTPRVPAGRETSRSGPGGRWPRGTTAYRHRRR